MNPEPNPKKPLPQEMLTPSEVARLRQKAKDDDAYFKEAFAHLRPKNAS